MSEFKSSQHAYLCVDTIFQLCPDNNVKFFALQILDDAIKVSLLTLWLRPRGGSVTRQV